MPTNGEKAHKGHPLGRKYPAATAVWERAWDRFIPFLEYGPGTGVTRAADGCHGVALTAATEPVAWDRSHPAR
ncbi:MAG TPA: hypothetical protein VHZ03_38845, partial [Trebonia sp.]|nr:hypothetical protein [Trebonia sp.]